jgi:N-acyl-D-aspartate/D-glutamate deacylase
VLETIAAARRRGVAVDCDAYPYDTATNPLRNLLPRWVVDGGIPAMLERLGRRDVRQRLAADIALDAVCDFVVADRGETRILVRSMSDVDVHRITGTPWVLVGSDGNALATSGPTSQGKPHPRYYGTHARLLGPCVRDLGLLTLPAAIHKTTGAAARALGLGDRGLLREGYWADVTVFDPARIADQGTYDDPHRYAAGVSTVVVNGAVVVDGGDHTGALPGRLLRRR